jgi:hypothetical protein
MSKQLILVKEVKSRRTTDPNDKNAQLNREKQKRYVDKVKPYQQLAKLSSLDEQIIGLILISHPEYAQIPKYILLQYVDSLLTSIKQNL